MAVGRGTGGVANGRQQTVVNDGHRAGGVLPSVTVQQVDKIPPVLVGDGKRGHGDGMIILDQDQPTGP